jgi:hypothetical protein
MSEQENTTSKPTNQAQVHVGKMADNCCDDHLAEEVRFYCTDCTILICDECVQFIHKTHDFKSFKKVVKEFMDTEGEVIDTLCRFDWSGVTEKIGKEAEAKLTDETTRFNAQAEKLVYIIYQIRDQKEREIQNMREKNKIALQQTSLLFEERLIEPSRKLKQLISQPGRANDREAVRIIMKLKEVEKTPSDKRLENIAFTSTFIATEIDENVIEKLFGELEIKEEFMENVFEHKITEMDDHIEHRLCD